MEKDDFLKKLEKLVAHAKSKHNTVDAGEINDFFVGDNLSPEQMDQIYSYLENRNIDVVPVLDEAMLTEDTVLLDDIDLDLDLDDDSFIKDAEEEEIDLDAVDLLEGIGTEDPVRMYLKEIGTVPLLTADEELDLAQRKADGDEFAKERLIEANLRLVVSIAKRYTGRGMGFLDLVQEGNLGLMKAVDHFDPTRMVKFSTYAVPMIIGEIRRYLRDNSPIRVSRSLRDTAYKAIYAKEGYIKRHMKEPTVQEIAEEIGIAKEEIVYALDAIQMPMSLHEPVYSDGQDALFVMDQVSDKKNKEENWIEELSLEAAMERLNERERYIITLRFFEGKTQMEVAEQINISQAQVSRLEKNALKIMRKYLLGK